MPQVINTNIASLNAQRNLNASQTQANTALERLSSGLRINSAKDDAAGLAISTRFQAQITGLNMAQRNANDGISLAQTAEGAMDEIINNMQRIRELAVQSANATNSSFDREALNDEVKQRLDEIDRISTQTAFNGLKVLDGTFGTQTFQVGANAGETIGISGLDSRGSQIGGVISRTANLLTQPLGSGAAGELSLDTSGLDLTATITADITLGGEALTVDTSSVANAGTLATAINNAITANGNLTGVTAAASDDGNSIVFSNTTDAAVTAAVTLTDDTGTKVTIDGTDGTLDAATVGADTDTLVTLAASRDYSGDPTVSFEVGGQAITFTMDTAASDGDTQLLAGLNTDLANKGFDNLSVQITGDNLELVNSSTTAYSITNVTSPAAAGTAQTGTIASEGTLTTAGSQELADLGADIVFTSGVTGSFEVDGTAIAFTVGADGTNNLSTVIGEINTQLAANGFNELTAVASGTAINIENGNVGTYSISDFTAADGGTANGSVTSTTPIDAAAGLTLAQSFESGNSVTFDVDVDGTAFQIEARSLNDIVAKINSLTVETGIRANLNAANESIIFSSPFGESYDVSITSPNLLKADGITPRINEVLNATPANNTVSVNDLAIDTAAGAEETLVAIDYAFDKINGFRAELGALQNRFESTIANLSTTSENLSAANSRIRDADFAAETAELARTQVLQSAGLSVLAQANARPQQVLQLLQG
ncbi:MULTISPECIES: flagellin [unclassified Marinobacter]|uniref:flagellin N-terminal helical domain-containing protein n=1 Tax=unclassified Marinobacter TaxID=83889 RepID=UPI00200C5C14|nr:MULTISPECIES: flagellin [unclassified Marinobacter]MCL1477392.1 flagellin [Marinobacter sp.]UQG57092.1 flagellin [Marinobacter sp. M4C]UQG65896.1 flagellin [Marinobacter sp. M2C]UQG70176.1 flagellin [Marinobacter sp. M1C]